MKNLTAVFMILISIFSVSHAVQVDKKRMYSSYTEEQRYDPEFYGMSYSYEFRYSDDFSRGSFKMNYWKKNKDGEGAKVQIIIKTTGKDLLKVVEMKPTWNSMCRMQIECKQKGNIFDCVSYIKKDGVEGVKTVKKTWEIHGYPKVIYVKGFTRGGGSGALSNILFYKVSDDNDEWFYGYPSPLN